MEDNEKWTITIGPETGGFGGFAPAWFKNSWPYYGNKNQAADMLNMNLIDPNVLVPGPDTADLTAGSETGAVTTLIESILKTCTSNNVSFGVGGAKVYKFSATAVTNDGTYPMTIDKGAVTGEDADDLNFYKSNLYIFYNHSGSAGDIAKVDIGANTIDPDWGSTVPTGAGTLQNAPHYTINGGDDACYFTNGQYVSSLSGTTLNLTALDFWTDAQTVSLSWNWNRVLVAVNRPNVTGSNFNQSGIYRWNGVSSSWEGDPIEVSGRIGAIYTKNGITFCWWQEATPNSEYTFGYTDGSQMHPLKSYTGTLPNQAQVGEYEGHIAWISNSKLYLYGAKDPEIAVNLFQYMSGKYGTVGAFASPFGTVLISSTDGSTHYSLAKESGYETSANYDLKAHKVSGVGFKSQIDLIQIEVEQLGSGARADFTLYYDKGTSDKSLTSVAYDATDTTKTIFKILEKGITVEDFKIDTDHSNGSASNPVKIRSVMIQGHYILNT